MSARTDLLEQLEAELRQGWPEPWWLQDRPHGIAGRGGEARARKPCCLRGHEFTEANTRWRMQRWRGRPYLARHCLACQRLDRRGVIAGGIDETDPAVRLLVLSEAA